MGRGLAQFRGDGPLNTSRAFVTRPDLILSTSTGARLVLFAEFVETLDYLWISRAQGVHERLTFFQGSLTPRHLFFMAVDEFLVRAAQTCLIILIAARWLFRWWVVATTASAAITTTRPTATAAAC